MSVFLYLAAAWLTLDVVLVLAWHGSHVAVRRHRAGAALTPRMTQRVYSLGPATPRRSRHLSPVRARRG